MSNIQMENPFDEEISTGSIDFEAGNVELFPSEITEKPVTSLKRDVLVACEREKKNGPVDAETVYTIVNRLQTAQDRNADLLVSLQIQARRSDNLRRWVIALCVSTMVLSLCNVAGSFTAARFIKDTTVSGANDLMSFHTGIRLGTTSKMTNIQMEPISSSSRRLLAEMDNSVCSGGFGAGGANCTVQGQIKYDQAKAVYEMLCPDRDEVEGCRGDAVSSLQLTCNGYSVSIIGF